MKLMNNDVIPNWTLKVTALVKPQTHFKWTRHKVIIFTLKENGYKKYSRLVHYPKTLPTMQTTIFNFILTWIQCWSLRTCLETNGLLCFLIVYSFPDLSTNYSHINCICIYYPIIIAYIWMTLNWLRYLHWIDVIY